MNTSLFSTTTLAQLDHVNLDLKAKSAADAVRELHGGICELDAVLDAERLLHDVLDRQSLGANCLDADIAMPHARTYAVNRLATAVGRSTSGVVFDEQHPAVRFVFLVGVPFVSVTEYLQSTAYFVRALRNPTLQRALLAAPTEEEFRAVWSLTFGRIERQTVR